MFVIRAFLHRFVSHWSFLSCVQNSLILANSFNSPSLEQRKQWCWYFSSFLNEILRTTLAFLLGGTLHLPQIVILSRKTVKVSLRSRRREASGLERCRSCSPVHVNHRCERKRRTAQLGDQVTRAQ